MYFSKIFSPPVSSKLFRMNNIWAWLSEAPPMAAFPLSPDGCSKHHVTCRPSQIVSASVWERLPELDTQTELTYPTFTGRSGYMERRKSDGSYIRIFGNISLGGILESCFVKRLLAAAAAEAQPIRDVDLESILWWHGKYLCYVIWLNVRHLNLYLKTFAYFLKIHLTEPTFSKQLIVMLFHILSLVRGHLLLFVQFLCLVWLVEVNFNLLTTCPEG